MTKDSRVITPLGDLQLDQPSMVTQVGGALFWSQLLRIIEVGTSFLFLIRVVRRLGPTEYGIFGTITSITAVASLITLYGFSDALNKFIPQLTAQSGSGTAAFVGRRIFLTGLLLTAAFCLILWFSRGYISRWLHLGTLSTLTPILIVLIAGEAVCGILSAASIGMWKLKAVFLIGSAVNILAAVGAIVMVSIRSATAGSAAFAAAIAFGVGSAAYLLLSRQWLFSRPTQHADMKPIWQFSNSTWLVRLSGLIVSPSIVVLIMGWLLGSQKEVAYFSCAYVPMMRIHQLILGWGLSVLPSLSSLKATRGTSPLFAAYRVYVKISAGLAVPVLAFVALHARPLIAGIFGHAFVPAGGTLQVYAVLCLASLIAGSGLTTLVLYTLDMAGTVVRLRLGVAAVHLALIYLLIPRYGAIGSVITMGTTGIIAAILELAFVPRTTRLMYPWGFIGKALIVAGICLGATALLHPASMASLTLTGFAYMTAYFLLLSRWHPLDPSEKEILARHPRMARILTYL